MTPKSQYISLGRGTYCQGVNTLYALACAKSKAEVFPGHRASAWSDHHACRRRHVFPIRHIADFGSAPAANRPGRPKSPGIASVAEDSKQSEFRGARDARHSRRHGAVSADSVVEPVRTPPYGSGGRAASGRGSVGRLSDDRTAGVPAAVDR